MRKKSKYRISLKEYAETLIKHINVIVDLKIDNIEKATTLAKAEIDRRLEGMNEFREQLKDQTGTFITRIEHDEITKQNASQRSVYMSYVISIIGIIIAIIAIFKG